MKLKRLTMKFTAPLDKIIHYQDQDVQQIAILETDVAGIKIKVKNELDKVIRGVNMVRILSPAIFDTFKMHVKNMEYKFEWMVSFNKISDTEFHFVFPGDTASLIYIKDISSKLGPLKRLVGNRLEGKDLALVQVLREKELLIAFEKYSFREMLLKPEDYSLSFDEFESDPKEPKKEEAPQPATITPEASLPVEKIEEKHAP